MPTHKITIPGNVPAHIVSEVLTCLGVRFGDAVLLPSRGDVHDIEIRMPDPSPEADDAIGRWLAEPTPASKKAAWIAIGEGNTHRRVDGLESTFYVASPGAMYPPNYSIEVY